VLSVDDFNHVGRTTGQAQRLRTVTQHRLVLALVSTLGSGRVESLADLRRAFYQQNIVGVAYRAFYNQLARSGFARFTRRVAVGPGTPLSQVLGVSGRNGVPAVPSRLKSAWHIR